MKPAVKIILTILMLAVSVGIFYMAYSFLQKNETSKVNSLKKQAEKQYLTHQYEQASNTYKQLIDSFNIQEDEVSLNYGNATYLAINVNGNQAQENDSLKIYLMDQSLNEYAKLSSSGNKTIASMAANQSGFVTIKKSDISTKSNTLPDSIIAEALIQFKNALVLHPNNESARYNYELLKKIAGYPETILAETKSLVAQKKYREAASLLESAMKRDKRLTQHKDLLSRIQTIIQIETGQTQKI